MKYTSGTQLPKQDHSFCFIFLFLCKLFHLWNFFDHLLLSILHTEIMNCRSLFRTYCDIMDINPAVVAWCVYSSVSRIQLKKRERHTVDWIPSGMALFRYRKILSPIPNCRTPDRKVYHKCPDVSWYNSGCESPVL